MANMYSGISLNLTPYPIIYYSQLERVPEGYFSMDKTHAIDDTIYKQEEYHRAFHHYIKVT